MICLERISQYKGCHPSAIWFLECVRFHKKHPKVIVSVKDYKVNYHGFKLDDGILTSTISYALIVFILML